MTLPVVEGVAELRAALRAALHEARRAPRGAAQAADPPIRFVPTMGALHEGHAALLRRAHADGGVALLSIFVNPTQFGPTEDLARYPRTPDADLALAAASGATLAWMPQVATLYPPGEETRVRVGAVAEPLCGALRPGHFEGVATVVTKLLVASGATHLYLGEKDFQQTVVLRRVISDLLLDVEVHVVPTVREPDGLAMSSRNRYLSPEERRAAAAIPRALEAARVAARSGATVGDALGAARAALDAVPDVRTQYLEVRDAAALRRVPDATGAGDAGQARIFFAGFVGSTRLIDNRALVDP